ncbi:hypothetical protein [Actinacidiphila glaucinigra]|uniref:hypothetical protein n=1 Tax=Actinacidiphila glaucinigra TaxID=235986 RepID=UPI0036E27603
MTNRGGSPPDPTLVTMLPAEPPTPAPEGNPPEQGPRSPDGPVPAGPPPDPADAATTHSADTGADDVGEYEPL